MQGRLGLQRLTKPNKPFRTLLKNHKIQAITTGLSYCSNRCATHDANSKGEQYEKQYEYALKKQYKGYY